MNYEKMSITELEESVKGKNEASLSAKKEMVEILIYLKTTSRFKENKTYAKSSFNHYIEDRFNIRPKTFYEMQKAFTRHPDETLHYGIGVVARIQRECGQKNAGKVLDEMKKTENKVKVLKRKKIDDIIKQHSTPRPVKVISDWKARYEIEFRDHEETKKQLAAAWLTIKEQDEQIEKLKATIEKTAHHHVVPEFDEQYLVFA